MDFVTDLIAGALSRVWLTLARNWYYLLLAVLAAALVRIYLDQSKLSAFLRRSTGYSVLIAIAVSVLTPLCSCGSVAVILGMMAVSMPWAPIVAFLVASPLTSPGQLFYTAALFGWPFSLAFFGASIILGMTGAAAAHVAEGLGWLRDQARFQPVSGGSGAASTDGELTVTGQPPLPARPGLRDLPREMWLTGRRIMVYFLGFAFVGYLLNGLIPQNWISRLFGHGQIFGVPLAATLGLPLYVNSDASLPLVASFTGQAMSPGAALAFLITGAGTSVGAISGALVIARWRVIGIVVGTLWVGGLVLGYAYNAVLAMLN